MKKDFLSYLTYAVLGLSLLCFFLGLASCSSGMSRIYYSQEELDYRIAWEKVDWIMYSCTTCVLREHYSTETTLVVDTAADDEIIFIAPGYY